MDHLGSGLPSLIYLKLSVSGHLTVFVTRTRGPFWSIRPANLLLGAAVGTQLLATFITIYGLFMAPLGWVWAGLVWGMPSSGSWWKIASYWLPIDSWTGASQGSWPLPGATSADSSHRLQASRKERASCQRKNGC